MKQKWTGKIVGALLGFLFTRGLLGVVFGLIIGHIFDVGKDRSMKKAWGGILGFMFAGPLGAIAGVYFGHALDTMSSEVNHRSVFQINFISILSYIIKVDGRIEKEEVNTVLKTFAQLGYQREEMERLGKTLVFALGQDIDLKQTCEAFKKVASYEERFMLLRVVYFVVMADGVFHAKEKEAIRQIVEYLEIRDYDFKSLQAEFVCVDDDHYALLGLKRGATKVEIKKAYRKLALTHHPDRVGHLGEEYVKIATEKFQKINEAYDKALKEL